MIVRLIAIAKSPCCRNLDLFKLLLLLQPGKEPYFCFLLLLPRCLSALGKHALLLSLLQFTLLTSALFKLLLLLCLLLMSIQYCGYWAGASARAMSGAESSED
jgi:hypothetical protein